MQGQLQHFSSLLWEVQQEGCCSVVPHRLGHLKCCPISPHMVVVGPTTATPAKALPVDLEEFVESAGDNGVVYASLGTTAIPGRAS